MDACDKNDKNTESARLLYGWLVFAVSALILAGLFAFLIAMARTPVVQELFAGSDFVRIALVGHVNLSFVIWFLAFEGALWTFAATAFLKTRVFSPAAGWGGLSLSVAGTAMITAACMLGLGKPLFVNYIPVIDHPVFYAGLLTLAAGIFITIANSMLTAWKTRKERKDLAYGKGLSLAAFGAASSAAAVFAAILCFGLSFYFKAASGAVTSSDLETVFWGGGHILQFANTMAMVSAWIFITGLLFNTFSIREGYGKLLYAVFLLFVASAPFLYLLYDIDSYGYRRAFTGLMQYGLGPSTVIFAAAVLFSACGSGKGGLISKIKELPWKTPEFSSLVISMALFAAGGIISLTIHGYNTKIPSHYHGAIGGVTTAFMGMTYCLIRALGVEIKSPRIARIQPYVYGMGQILFVIGMFWAGSHGVARKTFGSAQNLNDTAKIVSMAIVGIGGLIAITGGALFVVNAGVSLMPSIDNGAARRKTALKTYPEGT